MTQATSTNRNQEIIAIHIRYEDFYRIGGGLTIILVLIIIGSWLFGQNQVALDNTMLGYVTNVATEALSVLATIVVIDQLNRRREREERKLALFRQAKSRSNDAAVEALDQIQYEGWWDELLEHYTGSNENSRVNLSQVRWGGGLDLQRVNLEKVIFGGANLQGVNFDRANLQGAELTDTNLDGANLNSVNLQMATLVKAELKNVDLGGANLQETDLSHANLQNSHVIYADLSHAQLEGAQLQNAKLWRANLSGVNLQGANLLGAILDGGNLTNVTLPDGKKWTPDTDMTRFTNPDHPDFWQPSESE